MKKTIIAVLASGLLLIASCSKTNNNSTTNNTTGGSWTFKGTSSTATSCDTLPGGLDALNITSSNINTYQSLSIYFYYPLSMVTPGTYTVIGGFFPTGPSQIGIQLSLGGVSASPYYVSTGGNGSSQTVKVTVSSTGKISVSGSGIELQNSSLASDSAALAFNITETQ